MLTELGTFGARTRPLAASLRDQVLIIGLGQVGFAVASQIHEMLNAALLPRERREYTRLLAIAGRQSIRQEQLLPRENRLLLTHEPLRWSDIPGRHAALGVARWWPRTPNHPSLQADPSHVRAFGRLLLWVNAEIVGTTLHESIEWLALSSERERRPRSVLVVGSLAEPEGGGMIFDVVGRIRRWLSGIPTTVIGVFTVDAPFNDDAGRLVAMANVYASLKELDAVNIQPQTYQHEFPSIGRILPERRTDPDPHFDHITLTGNTLTSVENPENPLTEFAMTWLLGLAVADAPPLLPIPSVRAEANGRYRGYSSFGIAKLALPVQAALESHVVEVAKRTLHALIAQQPNDESVEAWAGSVFSRIEKRLMGQNLLDHHLLTDPVRKLRRRLSPAQIKARLGRDTRVLKSWKELAAAEWERLERENEPEEIGLDGVATPRDVLRRRIDNALSEGLRPLMNEVEAWAVQTAYQEGHGLVWTHHAYRHLYELTSEVVGRLRKRKSQAENDLAHQRDLWLAAMENRNMNALDELGTALISALVGWIGWESRLSYWGEILALLQDLLKRLDLALQQAPHEIEKLTETGEELRNALNHAINTLPRFPNGVLCTEDWLRVGVQRIPSIDNITPKNLISSIFKRWWPGDLPPARQLQKFLSDILTAARLTLQPYASYPDLHGFIMENESLPQVRNSLGSMANAAAPSWEIKAMTDLLTEGYLPPQNLWMIRESPAPFSPLSRPTDSIRAIRHSVISPDPDELLLIELQAGWSPENARPLREEYRRAYYRVLSDSVPLHIDRRWELTMTDLVHTSLRTEVAQYWDATAQATGRRSGTAALAPLEGLIRTLAVALESDPAKVQQLPTSVADIQIFLFPLKSFRLKIPPPQCAFVFILAQRGTAEVAEDLFRSLSANMLDENFFFVINISGRGDIEALLNPLRDQSYLPIELSESDIKHVVSAPKATSALRDIVINRVNLTAISPFYTRAPVPDHMFFGREREIADVRSKLATHSVVLIGGRRIGKTSTLQKINRALDAPDNPMVPYYLDCSNVLTHRHFFRRINREWNVGEIQEAIQFDEIVDELRERHPKRIPVFLLDEVDRLLKTDQADGFDEPLFRTFRSLSNEKLCQFVFSGEKLLLYSINNAHSVLFNFPKQVKLNPLRPDVVRRLVSEPFEMLNIWLEDSEVLIQQIYEISAGHPNIVQTICHALVEVIDQDKGENLLKKTHLGKAMDMHQVQVDIVETIWGQMHPLAKLVTLLWPENVHQMTLENILKLLQKVGVKGPITQLVKDHALPDLQLYNFIEQKAQSYVLIPTLFPTILDFMTDKKMEIRAILETANA